MSSMFKTTVIAVIGLIIISCGRSYPPEVYETLKSAGENRAELEKVLEHFADNPDSLKYDAAMFLIGNMGDHGYATYRWFDTSGAAVTFDVLGFPDFDSLLSFLGEIEDARGEIDYEKDTIIYDREIAPSDFLIRHIDLAFQAWREKPWARHLSYEQFRDYVLPYRGSNEPLEPWQEFFQNKYEGIEEAMEHPSDPIEAAVAINDDIMQWFKFDERYYLHPTDQGLREMLRTGMGRCEDITNLTIYAMRANGLAITSDYTPYWANHDNNHAWNTIIDSSGRAVQFMGAESNPGKYSLSLKYAKVYRKTFGKQENNLTFQDHQQEKVPPWLGGKSFRDVTAEYPNVKDLSFEITGEVHDSVDIVYLCVFNDDNWRAVDWSWIIMDSTDGEVVRQAEYDAIGLDIVYLPGMYLNEEIVPCGAPFVFTDGGITVLSPVEDEKIRLRLTSTTPESYQEPLERSDKTRLKSGQEYELYCWRDNDWQLIATKTAGVEPLIFEDVPAGALYRLAPVDSDNGERPFMTEDGQTIHWL